MTLVMGILNVTPDSFSDGGAVTDAAAAIARGLALREAGADIVDVGGESTRPGASPVPPAEERQRILEVVRELAAAGVSVSVDTMHASTAAAVLEAGADYINDVSGGLTDPDMVRVVADSAAQYILGHWPTLDHVPTVTAGVVTDVRDDLAERLAQATAAGLPAERIILDPGLGFAKTAEQNWQLLGRLDELTALGRPVLVGASRKRFLAPFAAEETPAARDAATAVVSVLAAEAGAWGVRVHDVAGTRAALAVHEAWLKGRGR